MSWEKWGVMTEENKSHEGTLLVVDDFELNRDMLSRRLQSRGFEVFAASSGRAALSKIDQLPFDLVLLDIMMPDMDGFEVLRLLRSRYTPTDLAIIMVTARDQSEDIVKALDYGADDYITKPIDFSVGLARIVKQLERRRTEIALRESEERYALAAQGANDGLWDWNLRTHKVYYSDRWKMMLGYDPSEIGNDIDEWFKRVHPDDLHRVKENIDNHLRGRTTKFSCEYRVIMKDQTHRWMLCRGSTVQDEKNVSCRMVGWQTDTTNRVQHDNLTSLPNRALFLDRVEGAIVRCKRSAGLGFGIFYLGVDRFKVINESLGHEMGDRLLIRIARRLEKLLRPGDTMARLGGDEFSLLSEELTGAGNATQIADRIMEYMAQPFMVDDQEAHVTLSIGIALGGGDHSNPEELLRRSHSAMSKAKKRGKHCYEFYTGDKHLVSKLQLENQLRRAMENKELYLVYQPQVDLKNGRIVGVEALLRWQNKELGLVSPGRFIPLAEESGLIVPIGDWVLRTACQQSRKWAESGLAPLRMGVNLSARQFRQNNICELVAQIIKETGMDAQYLDLELTESLLMDNIQQSVHELKRLHKLGASISVDDFGTGYSSLSYLKRFRIDKLKIDRSFVKDLTFNQDDAAIVSAIISMAHQLKMKVIAEGVETKEQLDYLIDLDCDEMQGFYFGKPCSSDDIEALLKEERNLF